ncbi:MAG TPA: DMT family transporter [bacterium]|nr:DMT family transporter [bacterium]
MPEEHAAVASTSLAAPPARSAAAAADAVLYLYVPLVWGLNYIVIKAALPAFASPLAFNAVRWAFAAAVLLLLVAVRRERLWVEARDRPRVLALALVGNALQQVTFVEGIRLTTAGQAALFMSLTPVLVAAASALMGLERVARVTWAGIGLSVAGAAAILHPGAGALPAAALWGDLLVFASAGCWAYYTIACRPLTQRYPPSVVATLPVLPAAAVLVLAGVPALRLQRWSTVGPAAWAGIAYSGGLLIALGYVAWSVAIRRIGASRTAALINLNPVVALIAAWLLLGERLDAVQAAGAALVIGGVALTRR